VPPRGRRPVVGHISRLSPKDIEKIVRVVTPCTNEFIYKVTGHFSFNVVQ
jgi:hypothetical protein